MTTTGDDNSQTVGLARVGWHGPAPLVAPGSTIGRVARVDRGLVTVMRADRTDRLAPIPSVGRARNVRSRPAVGDWVVVTDELVVRILPRTSELTRGSSDRGRDAATARGAQVVAANVDSVFLVHALVRDPSVRRIERELVLVNESGARPVVVLTKADLVDDPLAVAASVVGAFPNVDVHAVSNRTGAGIDDLHRYTADHHTVAFIGPSGVGKSSLVNRLIGDAVLEVGAVREGDQKGRHTTIARELVLLPDGGVLIDTPGLRAVALWDADDGFDETFADIDDLATRCRFSNCAHGAEPGCAVREAIEAGRLSAERVEHYRALDAELDRAFELSKARERGRKRR